MVRDFEEFGKDNLVLDDSKLSMVTFIDKQRQYPDWDMAAHPYYVRFVCDGALLEVTFAKADAESCVGFYDALKTAIYRNGKTPLPSDLQPKKAAPGKRSRDEDVEGWKAV